MMKKINISLLLALIANGGFIVYILLEKTGLNNWLVKGWILNIFILIYFLSFVFIYIEFWKKVKKKYLYSALIVNLIGVIMYVVYWLLETA